MDNLIDPTWVQKGEIGALFVLIISVLILAVRVLKQTSVEKSALTSIIVDVMNQSKERESKLMEFVLHIQPAMDGMLATQKSIEQRLTNIEFNFEEHLTKHKTPRSKGWKE